jgi:hypothetical protein
LRTGSPGLLRRINGLAAGDYATVGLNRPGPYNRPKVHEDLTVTLTSYPRHARHHRQRHWADACGSRLD